MRSEMRKAVCAIALTAVLYAIGTGSAMADSVFDVSGTFTDGPDLSGTITINTSTGLITSADLQTDGATFDDILGQDGTSFPGHWYAAINAPGFPGDLQLVFDASSLVNYSGGSLSTQTTLYHAGPPYDLASGTVTLASVPEPSSLVLAGIAAAGGLGVLWRRRRGRAVGKGSIPG